MMAMAVKMYPSLSVRRCSTFHMSSPDQEVQGTEYALVYESIRTLLASGVEKLAYQMTGLMTQPSGNLGEVGKTPQGQGLTLDVGLTPLNEGASQTRQPVVQLTQVGQKLVDQQQASQPTKQPIILGPGTGPLTRMSRLTIRRKKPGRPG